MPRARASLGFLIICSLLADDDVAGVRLVVAHDAFDEGGFAGAVAAEEGVEGAGAEFHGDVVERDEGAEAFVHGHDFEAGEVEVGGGGDLWFHVKFL